MAVCGLWPVIFQQHRAPGKAMWRWAWAVGWHCTLCGTQGGGYAKDIKDENDENDKENGGMGAMARDFSAEQGSRRGHGRWTAWLSAPPGGAMWRYISLRHGTLIFCAMSFASFMSFSSFSRLSVSALHIVYCQPTLSFFRTDTIHIFPKTAIFQKIFFKCLKLPVKQYGTLF